MEPFTVELDNNPNFIQRWLNKRLPCPSCGSEEYYHNITDSIDYYVSEYEVRCNDCGTVYNYWAYGSLEYPETRGGLIKYHWHAFKANVSWKMKEHWGFSNYWSKGI